MNNPIAKSEMNDSGKCPACGENVSQTWQHCINCGHALQPIVGNSPSSGSNDTDSSFSDLHSPSGSKISHSQNNSEPVYNPVIRRKSHKNDSVKKLINKLAQNRVAAGLMIIALIALIILGVRFLINHQAISNKPVTTIQEPILSPSPTISPKPTTTGTSTTLPTPSITPSSTNTPEPTKTPTPRGLPAIVKYPSDVNCQLGPSSSIYSSDGKLESGEVMLIGMDGNETWFEAVDPLSGKTCWISIYELNRDSLDISSLPIVVTPTPPGPVYYGYRYAECSSGWKVYSGQVIQCRKIPACYLLYPQESAGYRSAEEALAGCKNRGKNFYCISVMPYTINAIKPVKITLECSIIRTDHSGSDLNYVLYWVKIQ